MIYIICTRYDLAHVARWEPQNLYDLEHISWIRYVLHMSCAICHNGRL